MARISVELDVVHDNSWNGGIGDTIDEVLDYDRKTFGINAEVINPSGPGGGWPVVRFEGETEDMERFMLVYTGGDAEDAHYLLYGED